MEDMSAFERQLAARLQHLAGPEPFVDVSASVRAATTAVPKTRLLAMFGATRFVVASVIVALFGGFLLAGALTTRQGEERLPAAAPTSSASPVTTPDDIATGGPGTFSPAGSLAEPREGHTATLLQDGRVLVVGGIGGNGDTEIVLTSAEIWDPETGVFRPTSALGEGRSHHTATLLQDGRVLVVGGYGDSECCQPLASAEIWDPETGSFEATGSLDTARVYHTATLLQDGRVLVVGGNGDETEVGASTSAEIWDPETGEFRAAGALTEPFFYPAATGLADGRVLVMGGAAGRSAVIWDPATGSFGPTGSSAARHAHGLIVLLLDGRVLYIGGRGGVLPAEVWNPETDSFGPAGSLGEPRASHSATLMPDGRILVVGGGRNWDEAETFGPSAEIWDPVTQSFGPTGSLATGRGRHTATALPDGRVLVIGGQIGGKDYPHRALASAEVWEPSDGSTSGAVLS